MGAVYIYLYLYTYLLNFLEGAFPEDSIGDSTRWPTESPRTQVLLKVCVIVFGARQGVAVCQSHSGNMSSSSLLTVEYIFFLFIFTLMVIYFTTCIYIKKNIYIYNVHMFNVISYFIGVFIHLNERIWVKMRQNVRVSVLGVTLLFQRD